MCPAGLKRATPGPVGAASYLGQGQTDKPHRVFFLCRPARMACIAKFMTAWQPRLVLWIFIDCSRRPSAGSNFLQSFEAVRGIGNYHEWALPT